MNPAARRPPDKNTPAEKWIGVSKSGASPKTYQSDAAGVEVTADGGTTATSLVLLIIGGVLYRGSIGQSIVVKGRAGPARRPGRPN